MKLLIISDSHGHTESPISVIEKIKDKINVIIHLGDYEKDGEEIKQRYPQKEFFAVSGNCDYGTALPDTAVVCIGGKRLFLTHGHRYNVKFGLERILYAAEQAEADICLFGHTHIPLIEYSNGIVFMNPGSICHPRGTSIKTYGIIDIDEKYGVKPSIVGIYDNEYRRLSL